MGWWEDDRMCMNEVRTEERRGLAYLPLTRLSVSLSAHNL